MKKGKIRVWMILLSILTISIIPLNKAKAETSTAYLGSWQYNYTITSTNHGEIDIPVLNESGTNYQAFNSAGEGNIIFSIHAGNAQGGTGQIEEISIKNSNGAYTYTCQIGSMLSYTDNLSQRLIYTANCPVNFPSGIGMAKIHIRTDGAGILVVGTSQTATFISKDNVNINVNQQQVVNAITASQQATINAISNASSQAHTDAQATTNAINNTWEQEATHWEAMENIDISNEAKQQPNQQNYDSVHSFEEGIFSDLDDPNILALIDLGIDTETNNWIWNTMTGIFNANVRVMSMVISVLTLGLAKFLMGR